MRTFLSKTVPIVVLAFIASSRPGTADDSRVATDLGACSPAPAVKAALDLLPLDRGPEQSYSQFREQKLATIRALLHQYPDDLFVERADIDFQFYAPDRNTMIERYRKLREQGPDDARLAYLYGLTLVDRRTLEAIGLFQAALDKAPKFPWPHLKLVDIYSSPAFRDKEKAVAHIKSFLGLCPSTLEGYDRLAQIDDPELLHTGARRLRGLLQSRKDADAAGAYSTLWALEFKVRPPAEFEALRGQVARDLKRIRALKLRDSREWYDGLAEGYRLLNDEKQSAWVRQERQRRFPSAYYLAARVKWTKDHPYPKPEDPPEAKRVYYRALLEETARWLKERPNATHLWEIRLDAIQNLDDVPGPEIEASAEKTVKAALADAGPWGPESSVFLSAAEVLAKNDLHPERVLELARQGLAQLEIDSKEPPGDLYAARELIAWANFDSASARTRAQALVIDARLKLGQAREAHLELAQLDEWLRDLKSVAGDNEEFQMTSFGEAASYWRLAARLAVLETRRLDAMAFYQNALLARLEARSAPETGRKDVLADDARKLWEELGGTEEGWQAWYGRRAAAMAGASRLTWDKANEPLPPFELADFSGRTWSLADLKGKVTLLNFWASW